MTFFVLAAILVADTAPTPSQLIRAAIAARKAQDEKGWKFTYHEDEEQFENKKGQVVSRVIRTYDVIMLEGEPYRKLILSNGEPLDAKTQKRVDEDLEKARAERRKRTLS